ncbi:hypothetical protein V495_04961 [Pseudogymnoascus sp. VKM F-4514 (FW-929)]|nr:hypothetical protein V495_04961 [Pseudogymnoascus sp. VKM F-4514 (FW-929)]KFY67250.1 hypothetical protein V497_00487 [Pseudogymnoascus sp. VKM F-4516 (FW-969)]
MKVSIILPQNFLPLNSVQLGRFITSIEHPYQNHHDPPVTNQPPALIVLRDSYTSENNAGGKSGFSSSLTSLLSARVSKRAKKKVLITTEQMKRYILDNSDLWFERATRIQATRVWIERALDRGQDIYMVVGFHTVINATISQESDTKSSVGGKISALANLPLAAAGIVAPLGDLVDPGVSTHYQDENGSKSQFVARGEQICAFEYRKLSHRWLSSKDIDKSWLLKECHWSAIERTRDEEDGEDDIFEAELTDIQDLGGDWEKEVVGDAVLFMRPLNETEEASATR